VRKGKVSAGVGTVINNAIFTHVIQMWRMGVSRLRLI